MRRFALAAVPFTLLLGAACGDGADKDESTTPSADATLPQDAQQQPQVPDKQLPTPTPIPDTEPIVQVVAAGKPYLPTRTDLASLPKVTIDANGKSYQGVTLAALAEQAGGGSLQTATIQGTRVDNLRLGAIRFPIAEIGGSTVFVVDESGHLLLASTSVPVEQWLKDVTGIALN